MNRSESIAELALPEVDKTTAPETVAGELPVNGAVPRHLVMKLSQVLGELERIPKNGHNREQNYAFVRESDCADAIRRELAKVGVFIFSTVEHSAREAAYVTSTGKQMFLFQVWVRYTFAESESGERWDVQYPGEALDFGDKGLYKAITGSMKYMLMKEFLISSGDDPENDSHGEDPHGQKAEGAPPSARRETRAAYPPPSEPQVVEGKVTMAVTEKASKTGKAFCAVYIRRTRYATFDHKMFPALLASNEKVIRIRVVQVTRGGKKFWNILDVLPPAEGVAPASTDITNGPWNDVPAA